MTPPALRPFLPADAPALAELFRRSVLELAADDYSDAQREAWAGAAEDETAFGARLAALLTLVATRDRSPVGFASLKDNSTVEMLYVAPEAAGTGVATTLLDALERLAVARGATRLDVEASDTAEPLFRKRGYEPQQRSTVMRGGEWLARTLMRKAFAPAANKTHAGRA